MNPIIENLRRLNRKERFHLLQSVLGGGSPGSDSFTLSDEFRENLGRELGLTVPSDAFAAMDYQLDWIYVALYLALRNPEEGALVPKPDGDWFNSNQEDTDLLVAFECSDEPGVCHLVLVEAKCETGWTNKQVQSKLSRLQHIHEELQLAENSGVRFHWVATSPERSEGLRPKWPPWLDWGSDEGGDHWIRMPVGPHCRAVRCNERGKPDRQGSFWQLMRG
ncbi:MAG: hypothetical protein FJX75_09275 [Armatimonadetes bacterium]|nr:hypothetical protein [Armatimonadota bacterium]MBM4036358.1 hypothetical protein [Planctomycetota bacterium]